MDSNMAKKKKTKKQVPLADGIDALARASTQEEFSQAMEELGDPEGFVKHEANQTDDEYGRGDMPHPDTILLDVLQSLLDKRRYTGKIQVRLSKKNKGLEIVEVRHEFPQFSDVREAIKDFGETHGMMGS